jgi:HPt (histidine-containing phosphotransfer) domain-containing protein
VPTDDVLDAAVVAGLRRAQGAFGNATFIKQLVGLFRVRTPEKIDRIRQALADSDAATVRDLAHGLRSNCGMLGATRMADACARMEDAASRADFASAAEALRDAEAQLPLVLAALVDLTDGARHRPP